MTVAAPDDLPVADHRRGAGPALVFLHYWGGSSRTWDPLIDRLGDRETVTVDFRGWSRSRHLPGPFDLHRLARDTHDVIDRLGLDSYVLVGRSMGGKVAQIVAGGRPHGLLGAVLVAPGPARPAAGITPDYQAQLAHAYDSAETVAVARDTVLSATPLPAGVSKQVAADSLAGSAEARAEWPLRGIAEDITGETVRIEVATLVVAGAQDRVEPVEVLRANLLPYSDYAGLVVVDASGHLIPLEATDELARLVAAFTDGLVNRRRPSGDPSEAAGHGPVAQQEATHPQDHPLRPEGEQVLSQAGIAVADRTFRFSDGHVNWYVLEDGGRLTVVDGGMPNHMPDFLRWLDRRGQTVQAVEAVVLTHGHADHMGIVRETSDRAQAPVHVHAADEALAKGRHLHRPPRRIRRLWRPRVAVLMAGWAKAGVGRVRPLLHASQYQDADVLEVPGSPCVLHTPGHSPGSSCLHLPDRDLLLSGDALVTLDVVTGRRGIGIMPGTLNDDPRQALRSLEVLSGVRAGVLLPGHGEPHRAPLADALTAARGAGIDWRPAGRDSHSYAH